MKKKKRKTVFVFEETKCKGVIIISKTEKRE